MSYRANPNNKFRIHTLGCKVNQYESQAMRELLVGAGFEESGAEDPADIYVVNTCTVTAEADRESRSIVGRLHRQSPQASIVVTGCLAEKDSAALESMTGVTKVLKNSDKRLIARAAGPSSGINPFQGAPALTVSGLKGHSKAFLKIQDGCENRCSYCKVPIVRSRLESKPLGAISSELQGLVENGFREIVLTGICLGSWGKDINSGRVAGPAGLKTRGLVDVLEAIDKIRGDFRIRLSSIEPKYITDDLIEVISAGRRICPHLHIPFQSGDDSVLKLMNRPYTSADYRAIVERVRSRMPRIAVTTDMLVGFPGESGAGFDNTIDFIRAVAPSRTHIFTFSPREGTAAYGMPGAVDSATLKERRYAAAEAALETALAYKKSFIGDDLEVLVENSRDGATGLLKGYSGNYIQVFFAGPDNQGRKIVPVRVTGIESGRVMGLL